MIQFHSLSIAEWLYFDSQSSAGSYKAKLYILPTAPNCWGDMKFQDSDNLGPSSPAQALSGRILRHALNMQTRSGSHQKLFRTCNFVRDARMSHGQTGSGQSQRTVYTTRNGHKRAPALPFREDEPSQVKKKSRKMQAWFSYCFLRRAFFSSSYIHFSYQEQYLWNHLEQGAGCTAQKQTWPTIPKAKIVQPPTWAASNFSPHHVEIQPFTEGLNSIG